MRTRMDTVVVQVQVDIRVRVSMIEIGMGMGTGISVTRTIVVGERTGLVARGMRVRISITMTREGVMSVR
jgi:hypothetical protein